MGIVSCLLGGECEDVRFVIMFGDKEAAEVDLEGKNIVIDIINPLFAVEAVIEKLRGHEGAGIELKDLKKQGYSIIIRWKGIEIEL